MSTSIIFRSIRKFSTTEPKKVLIPQLAWIIVKPISKLGALIFGRTFRKWWQKLPKNKQDVFKNHLKRNAKIYFSLMAGTSLLSTGFYFTHLEVHPITGRKRFIIFSPDQLNEIETIGFNSVLLISKLYLF
jgi:metalloendopeptidase OMA1, mitochondrial